MSLQQAANEAMAYLDSVGVAADWDSATVYSHENTIRVYIDSNTYYLYQCDNYQMPVIKRYYPQKSPN